MIAPRVKVCGITRFEDADLAVRLGASAIGFVLWDRSPRRITAAEAAAIARALPPFVTRVGVFVNSPAADVGAAVRDVGLDAVQLHGDEDVEDYKDVAARLIKVVSPETEQEVSNAVGLSSEITVLVDATAPVDRG